MACCSQFAIGGYFIFQLVGLLLRSWREAYVEVKIEGVEEASRRRHRLRQEQRAEDDKIELLPHPMKMHAA
jgi:hypothetical protein